MRRIWKQLSALLLVLMMALSLTGCGAELAAVATIGGADGPTAVTVGTAAADTDETGSDAADAPQEEQPPAETEGDGEEAPPIDEEGWYYSPEDVSLYLYTYGYLPENFITKAEARELGWEGGSVEEYAPGYAIGGDVFQNREGLLPEADGRVYYECDIDTDGYHSRGSRRICFSNDGLIYYTPDHYESFTLLYGEE